MSKDENDKTKRLISGSGEIAGSAVGGALGFFAGGPVGAAFGAAGGTVVGKLLTKIGSEIHDRFLAPRQQTRVGAVCAVAVDTIKKRLENGESIRDDDFFENEFEARSKADEVFEGVLLKSKDSYQEKKVPYLGKFFANTAFDSKLSAERANLFLNLFERVTYRQLCLLRVIYKPGHLILRNEEKKNRSVSPEEWGVLQEINELVDSNLVRQVDAQGNRDLFWGLGAICPARLTLTMLGIDMVEYFDLVQIPLSDQEEASKLIRPSI
jgi:hypothetical protein